MTAITTAEDREAASGSHLPSHWTVKRLGDIASVSAGGTPSRAVRAYWDGDIPWITTSQIGFAKISEGQQFITKLGLQHSAAKMLPPGCLLMALYGQGKTRGKVGILGIEAATNQACAAIVAHPDVVPDYLFHYLASRYNAIRGMSNAGNQDNLNGAIVRSIEVVLPPFAEQRSIACALNATNQLLATLDQLIEKKRAMKAGVMQQLLTGRTRLPGFRAEWVTRRLDEIAMIKRGQLLTRASSRNGNVPVIAAGLKPAHFHTEANRGPSTITISASGANAGHVLFHSEPIFASDCSTIERSPGYDVLFVYFALAHRQGAIRALQVGGAQPHVYPNQLRSLEIAIPDDQTEQTAIATVLSSVTAEIDALQMRRDKTNAIREGMTQALLTGRLRLPIKEEALA